uniref:PDZ domain-containing protein n=1 Tax=Macrostomum lignano TaxID=282301 RepID=A0A1I8H7H9_9PLAT
AEFARRGPDRVRQAGPDRVRQAGPDRVRQAGPRRVLTEFARRVLTEFARRVLTEFARRDRVPGGCSLDRLDHPLGQAVRLRVSRGSLDGAAADSFQPGDQIGVVELGGVVADQHMRHAVPSKDCLQHPLDCRRVPVLHSYSLGPAGHSNALSEDSRDDWAITVAENSVVGREGVSDGLERSFGWRAATEKVISSSLSMPARMTSPDLTGPTPAGVPVSRISPGSIDIADRATKASRRGTGNSICLSWPDCLSWSLTRSHRRVSGPMASGVIGGSMALIGQEVSKHLARVQGRPPDFKRSCSFVGTQHTLTCIFLSVISNAKVYPATAAIASSSPLADNHSQFDLVMNLVSVWRQPNRAAALQQQRGGGLHENHRLRWHPVAQLGRVLGVVSADRNNFAAGSDYAGLSSRRTASSALAASAASAAAAAAAAEAAALAIEGDEGDGEGDNEFTLAATVGPVVESEIADERFTAANIKREAINSHCSLTWNRKANSAAQLSSIGTVPYLKSAAQLTNARLTRRPRTVRTVRTDSRPAEDTDAAETAAGHPWPVLAYPQAAPGTATGRQLRKPAVGDWLTQSSCQPLSTGPPARASANWDVAVSTRPAAVATWAARRSRSSTADWRASVASARAASRSALADAAAVSRADNCSACLFNKFSESASTSRFLKVCLAVFNSSRSCIPLPLGLGLALPPGLRPDFHLDMAVTSSGNGSNALFATAAEEQDQQPQNCGQYARLWNELRTLKASDRSGVLTIDNKQNPALPARSAGLSHRQHFAKLNPVLPARSAGLGHRQHFAKLNPVLPASVGTGVRQIGAQVGGVTAQSGQQSFHVVQLANKQQVDPLLVHRVKLIVLGLLLALHRQKRASELFLNFESLGALRVARRQAKDTRLGLLQLLDHGALANRLRILKELTSTSTEIDLDDLWILDLFLLFSLTHLMMLKAAFSAQESLVLGVSGLGRHGQVALVASFIGVFAKAEQIGRRLQFHGLRIYGRGGGVGSRFGVGNALVDGFFLGNFARRIHLSRADLDDGLPGAADKLHGGKVASAQHPIAGSQRCVPIQMPFSRQLDIGAIVLSNCTPIGVLLAVLGVARVVLELAAARNQQRGALERAGQALERADIQNRTGLASLTPMRVVKRAPVGECFVLHSRLHVHDPLTRVGAPAQITDGVSVAFRRRTAVGAGDLAPFSGALRPGQGGASVPVGAGDGNSAAKSVGAWPACRLGCSASSSRNSAIATKQRMLPNDPLALGAGGSGLVASGARTRSHTLRIASLAPGQACGPSSRYWQRCHAFEHLDGPSGLTLRDRVQSAKRLHVQPVVNYRNHIFRQEWKREFVTGGNDTRNNVQIVLDGAVNEFAAGGWKVQ